jgi:hypothetical protein
MPEPTREELIEQARALDQATFDAEACAAGPGRYEGAADLALTVAVDIIALHGFADDQGGTTEFGGRHGARVGRYVLWTDAQGFRTLEEFDSGEAASVALEDADAEMWAAEDGE